MDDATIGNVLRLEERVSADSNDKNRVKYLRFFHELAQAQHPAKELYELLNNLKNSSRENKTDSLESFIVHHAESLGLKNKDLMGSLLKKLADEPAFRKKLQKIAEGKK